MTEAAADAAPEADVASGRNKSAPETVSASTMAHVQFLAETIGPRGSTTPQERQAAEYAERCFEAAGLETRFEPFTATVSGWMPFMFAALLALISVSFAFMSRFMAALLGVVMVAITVSVFLEMYFRPNLLRLLVPKGQSQNVWARVPAAAQPKRRLLLVAHLDTHRTPWAFTSPGRLKLFKLMTSLGVAAFVLLALSYLMFAVAPQEWSRYVALGLTPILVFVFILTLQPERTPYTAGANDNASGAAVLLSLAERLAQQPLANTEVWALASGSEEVGSQGMQAFIDEHLNELKAFSAVSIDNVGGAGVGVCYTSVEGMVFPLKPSAELFSLAEELRRARPDLNAYSLPYTTLHTDATCLMANGVPALSFVGLTPTGVIPNWHQESDLLEHVDPCTVARTEEFVWELLQSFDTAATTRRRQASAARAV